MSNVNNEFFEVVQDYTGREGESKHFNFAKGDIVRLIKKELVWTTVEKDGHIVKVPNGMLRKITSPSEASQPIIQQPGHLQRSWTQPTMLDRHKKPIQTDSQFQHRSSNINTSNIIPQTQDIKTASSEMHNINQVQPQHITHDNNKNSLYITNLSPQTTEYDLIKIFTPYKIIRCVIPSNQPPNSTHYGIADFINEEDAYWAFEYGQGKIIRGKELQIRQCNNQQTSIINVQPQNINNDKPSKILNIHIDPPPNIPNIPPNAHHDPLPYIPLDPPPNFPVTPLNKPIIPQNAPIIPQNVPVNTPFVQNVSSLSSQSTIQFRVRNLDISIQDIKLFLAQFQPQQVCTYEDAIQSNSLIATVKFANSELATNAVNYAQGKYLKGSVISAELIKSFEKR